MFVTTTSPSRSHRGDASHARSDWRFAGNEPLNYADPSGLRQAGHPLMGNTTLALGPHNGSFGAGPSPRRTLSSSPARSLSSGSIPTRVANPLPHQLAESYLDRDSLSAFPNATSLDLARRREDVARALTGSDVTSLFVVNNQSLRDERTNIDNELAYRRLVTQLARNGMPQPPRRDNGSGASLLGEIAVRGVGALKVGQAAAEYAVATALVGTGLGTPGALIVGAHATDVLTSGFTQLVSGQPTQTVGSQVVRTVANATGFQHQAEGFAFLYDLGPTPYIPRSAPTTGGTYTAIDDVSGVATSQAGTNVGRQGSGYWWQGRYSSSASQPGAYERSGGLVFPTRRNSGLTGDGLRGAQEAFAKVRLLEGNPVARVRGQAGEAGLTALEGNSRLADRGAENAVQRALNWYNGLTDAGNR